MQAYEAAINNQYGQQGLGTKLLAALQQAGKDIEKLTREDLAPFEELHIRGREATRALARLAGLAEGMEVLDAGSGIGGPARTLAAEFGCRVAGLDLTHNFTLAAEMLTARLGLGSLATFHQGNALAIPFDDNSFDIVWIQHMSMNIEDKARLFREFRRVLRPGGRLAFHEILAGPTASPYFPVPWASNPSISYLSASEELRRLLAEGGFKELAWVDDTEECINWYRGLFAAAAAAPPGANLLGGVFKLLVGDDFPTKGQNVLRNMEEGRIKVAYGVLECGE